MNDALSRLTGYLGLVGLVALLLGGIGVASAVVVFIRQRLDTVAVLRCLGATPGRVFGCTRSRPPPWDSAAASPARRWACWRSGCSRASWRDCCRCMSRRCSGPRRGARPRHGTLGRAGVRRDAAARGTAGPAARRAPSGVEPDRARGSIAGASPRRAALAATTVALAALQVGSWRQGAIFSSGVAVALLVLWGAAWALIRAARRWLPGGWPYVWRQGLANLHRPSNQTTTVVLAIGFGAFLLGTLFLVQYNLLRTLRHHRRTRRDPTSCCSTSSPTSSDGPADARRGRLSRARGRCRSCRCASSPSRAARSRQSLADTTRGTDGDEGRGAAGRSAASTARPIATPWSHPSGWSRAGGCTRRAPRPRSRWSATWPRELGVGVGDEIVWDVQGVPLPTRIASLREVDWARFEPNFFVVFAPGALEDAPQSLRDAHAGRARRGSRGAPAAHGRAVRQRHQLDLSSLQETLERLIDRVVLAIRFMALFTLGTGALVLVGRARHQPVPAHPRGRAAPDARRHARRRSSGSCWRSICRSALLAALVALALATAAAWALARFVFEGGSPCRCCRSRGSALAVVALTVSWGWPTAATCSGGRRSRCCGRELSRRVLYSGGSLITRFCSMLAIDLTGKRALVAGVSDDGGFGFAIAKALAEAGADHLRGQLAARARHLHQAARAREDGRVDAAGRRPEARVRADLPARRGVRHARRRARGRSGRTSATRTRATSASRG